MTFGLPFVGNLLISVLLVLVAYAFGVAVVAGRRGRAKDLRAARSAAFAVAGLTAVTVALLAFAFLTHDFRIRYVARYSDRSMPFWYLLSALWGGQDGSILWWLFLLSGYTTAALVWFRNKALELQPWIIATLMSIFAFFVVLMLFPANPFQTFLSNAPLDGEGLNPLLQNYWMAIHPPALYMGFVGWSVPFSIVVAALIRGQLDVSWVKHARLWAMIAWTFLSLGLLLGCVWSYEELGWGGYWAWDPVENASFMPWLVATAYIHSAMVQERYEMLRVWNVFLLCLTFFMTIFGTFLTRSGLIASVHSFARSDIGIFFVYYLVVLLVAIAALIIWRLPKLKPQNKFLSLRSREFAFLFNNWILLGMMVFVLVATTFPLLSEWLRGEEVTVGPPFYNQWMIPFGIVLLLLMGIGPMLSWRRATNKSLARAFTMPLAVAAVVAILHLAFGNAIGFSAFKAGSTLYPTLVGKLLSGLRYALPITSSTLSAFVFATVFQEVWRGTRARMKSKKETPLLAFFGLILRARRRFGGYVVHVGIVVMFLGFTGAVYDTESEATLMPGEIMHAGSFQLRYDGPKMEVDPNKRMIFAKMTLLDEDGDELGKASPGKFIYRTHPQMPTTEVHIRSRIREDVYVIMSRVDPQTKQATFQVKVRPLVIWIWIGGIILLLGSVFALWPTTAEILGRRIGQSLLAALLALLFVTPNFFATTIAAQSDSSSSLHAGTPDLHSSEEKELFSKILCQCGGCERLPMDGCICEWAEEHRAEVRRDLASGMTQDEIVDAWRAEFGAAAISVPGDKGLDRALWAIPLIAFVLAGGGLISWGRKRLLRDEEDESAEESEDGYDARIDAALSKLEEDA